MISKKHSLGILQNYIELPCCYFNFDGVSYFEQSMSARAEVRANVAAVLPQAGDDGYPGRMLQNNSKSSDI